MKLTIDTDEQTAIIDDGAGPRQVGLYSSEAFSALSRAWVKVGWGVKYGYGFSWMGVPVIQLPEDMIRAQEAIYRLRPDVVLETGVAHGGSLVFYASLFEAMGHGRVIGVDLEIRSHNRSAIESHSMARRITLVEGDSVGAETQARVRDLIQPGERVLVILDSNHSYDHVTKELDAYANLVSIGSYIVATDGLMQDLADAPGGRPGWEHDNPAAAARDFAAAHPEFVLESPPFVFNETKTSVQTTHWPDAWLRRVR